MNLIQRIFWPQKFTGWHMAGALLGFFGTIITVNMIMAYFATSTWTGLVVKNSYVASQNFNTETAALKAQQAMGWDAASEYRDGTFGITLTGRDQAPLGGAIVTAKVGRPAYESDDRTVQLLETAPGQYEAPTDLGPGIWTAALTVTGQAGELWTRILRFEVK